MRLAVTEIEVLSLQRKGSRLRTLAVERPYCHSELAVKGVAMSMSQIEAGLMRAGERLSELRRQISETEEWEAQLRTALSVLARLGEGEATQPLPIFTARTNDAAPREREHMPSVTSESRRVHKPATGLPAEAGQALIAMLRQKGDFIRPMEAVTRLKAEHGIQIGLGKSGRETSDLSAAVGHGRVPGLIVTRGQGYGLEEWKGIAPVDQARVDKVRDDDQPSVSEQQSETEETSMRESLEEMLT